ncbi:MAG: AAA family ATPase [Cyanobacteria bacterium P01_D01_bin.44]
MALAGLLALVVGASVTTVQSAGLIAEGVDIVTSGIIGNRVDAAFLLGCQSLLKTLKLPEAAPVSQDLRKALWLSYLQALISIGSECKAELVGQFPQQYRGQPVYPKTLEPELRWLDGQLSQLEQALRAAEKNDLTQAPELSLQALEAFLSLGKDQSQNAAQLALHDLIDFATASNLIPRYAEKLQQAETGLFERVCGFFAKQLSENAALQAFFETQLLVQINNNLAAQQITLADVNRALSDISQAVPQALNQALEKLEAIESEQTVLEERTHSILRLSQEIKALLSIQWGDIEQTLGQAESSPITISEVIPPNPFGPLSGRIDSPEKFFGREQTLQRIFEILNSGSSVALIGEREIGKSSLLKAVQYQAREQLNPCREPIYLDLRHVEDESDFYFALCDQIGIEESKGFRLKRALEPKRLLLLLDELEKMTWDGFTNQVREQLRGLAEGKDAPLRLVVAASKSLDRLFPDSSDGNMVSPLSGICLEEIVKPWDESVIRAFIADRLGQTPIQFAEAEIVQIIQTSQGQPRQVLHLCYKHYASFSEQSG